MHFVKLSKPKKSVFYETYWEFAAKRNDIFLSRLHNPNGPWTTDAVLRAHRFTNVFRALDRVSQHLIKIQYETENNAADTFLKTIIFKLFNKSQTYQYLEKEVGCIAASTFKQDDYDALLTQRMAQQHRIYSAAYIMPSAGSVFGHKFKHSNHLALIHRMLQDNLPEAVQACSSMESVYKLLLAYPSLGKFLAFQYTIDLNYSSLTNFSEMDFVVAGPGAVNGIAKCFSSLGDYSYEDVIRLMADEQEAECANLHVQVPKLWGRRLQLIDCQNLFCEVDKYLRGTRPEATLAGGRTRIKQKFSASSEPLTFFFPPKWGLNQYLTPSCQQRAAAGIFS